MASEVDNVTVTIPFLSYKESLLIQGAYKWKFEDTTLVMAEEHSRKGVHITSDTPISVIAVNSRGLSYTTADGTIVYPVNCLSSEYLVEEQSHRTYKTSQYAIIGTQNTTINVTITNKRGRVFYKLGYLESYFLQEKDLRGTSISATDNVVMISGSECGYVPSGMTASCDHLVNQVPPRSMFGHAYIVAQHNPRKGFSYRIKAAKDNIVLTVRNANGELVANETLDVLTEFFKMELDSQPLSIAANKGVIVTQYALDVVSDDLGLGDPSMVSALNSFASGYSFVIPDYFMRVGVTIYISVCHDPYGLFLDGKEISNMLVTLVTIPHYGDYNVINIDLESKWTTYGSASLSHTERDVTFGAIMYGIRVEGAFAWRIGGKL
ncbi:uncharacterized protein LOC132743799 [Ruditapes philippinarum]|uniref:uncharacterized protein LOC132743799 n=1 Tax=Ruditapes philippinarum TaxID=129788 RepID=UPI00295BC280|nr:uncharacterized protein LOC132743799 [Ruditapes philippinarum]